VCDFLSAKGAFHTSPERRSGQIGVEIRSRLV